NEDSLKLVEAVTDNIKHASRVLDVGAGCGVVGIELAQKIRIDELELLEVQDVFKPYLEENISLFIPSIKSSITICSLSKFQTQNQYDLIVCNPPYYLPGKGKPNKDINRGICRSFQIDSWKELLQLFYTSLTSTGTAWVVIKNDEALLQVIEKESKLNSLLSSMIVQSKIVIIKFYREV